MANGEDIEVVHWVNVNEQLKAIGVQVKEIATDLVALRRQHDQAGAERANHEWRLKELETWRTQAPQNARSNWNLSMNGCSTIAFVVSAAAAVVGGLAGVVAVILTLVLR